MKKQENIEFKLKYSDGETHEVFKFKTDSYYDIIELADSKLEQAVWGAKIDMDTEELRVWKRLDATTYRAGYSIPKNVMEARFSQCVQIIKDYLSSVKEETSNEDVLNKETEEFFN